ncbi:farnesol dehydrogenase-like [Apis dorsata]|uniref:farnesol dehydrogenase-like n=1 Tax=Apis dorsata TaxID=7462 RepID=UPI0003DF5DF9|nr:farnesol dehydrogenase-like [Apis dorsata]
MHRWRGKVAIVTGASAGIGAAIAKALPSHDIKVVGLARNIEKLEKLADELGRDKFFPIKCDVTKEEDILKACKWVEKELGGADILINNAGVAQLNALIDQKTEDYRNVLDTNLLAPAIFSREVILSIKKRNAQGHIINISSISESHLDAILIPLGMYGASKSGLRSLGSELRNEIIVKELDIKVTNIAPGTVITDMLTNAVGSNVNIPSTILLPEDIADAVVYALGTPIRIEIPQITIIPHNESFIPKFALQILSNISNKYKEENK